MIGFFLKKNFFDGWDHFLPLAGFNIVLIVVIFLFFTLIYALSSIPILAFCTLGAGCLVFGVLLLTISNMTAQIADYKSFSIKDIMEEMRQAWLHGSLFAGLELLSFALISITIPYYFALKNFLGFFLGISVIWIFIIIQLSLLWFFPIRSRLESNFRKCLKKCFIIFFDNTGFTLFMVIYSLILIVLTPFLAFLMPGFSGLLLAWNNAFKLRMYKYDWLEQHPEIPLKIARKQIPWDELLAEDRETVGTRSIKNLIFPWKD